MVVLEEEIKPAINIKLTLIVAFIVILAHFIAEGHEDTVCADTEPDSNCDLILDN